MNVNNDYDIKRWKKKQRKYDDKFMKWRIKEQFKSDKRSFKQSMVDTWTTTTTKKIVWIAIFLTVMLWVIDIPIVVLSSTTLLSIPELVVTTYTECTKEVTIGMFATIVFYFIRAFMDSWSIAKTGIDVSKDNTLNDVLNRTSQSIDEDFKM